MTHLDESRIAIELACQIGSRTDKEQRQLLAFAWRCDKEANKLTTENKWWQSIQQGRYAARTEPLWELTLLVRETRILEDGGRDVDLPAKTRTAETKARAEWQRVADGGSTVYGPHDRVSP